MNKDLKYRLDLLFKMDVIKAYLMPYIAPGVNLKVVTDLGYKDQNGNKRRFYEETLYKSSKYKNTDELMSATYRVNSYLALEYPNPQYQQGSNMMKNHVLFIRAFALEDLTATMREADALISKCFKIKDGNAYIFSDKVRTITTYPSSTSVISFTPDICFNKSKEKQEMGMRVTLNEEFSMVLSAETTWPEFIYRIARCDLTMLSFQMIQSYMAMLPGMAVSRLGDTSYSATKGYAPYWDDDPDDIVNRPDSVRVNGRPTTQEEKKKSFFSDL